MEGDVIQNEVIAASIRRTLHSVVKNLPHCHPEEPKAVLSETKGGSLYWFDSLNAGIFRFAEFILSGAEGLAQNGSTRGFSKTC